MHFAGTKGLFYVSTRGAPLLTTTTGRNVGESVAHELNRIRSLIFYKALIQAVQHFKFPTTAPGLLPAFL
jgi:hypothetical protein